MKITRFTLAADTATLTLDFIEQKDQEQQYQLSFEYLRVFSPVKSAPAKGKQAQGANPSQVSGWEIPLIAHKKQVLLKKIEAAGKHGYRFIFDDQHQAIYSEAYLLGLCRQQQVLWPEYLNAMKNNKLTREANISITQL
ncbi:gamma-butyrobetaine hydroxylase-like domain-containing protein [Thalassomonas actiniarum]|uniref:DUF971 domain-containing protein n=1 Tax=Thalassomonas actiniarum TaxID=485447 RepID=A0AAE9YPI0_9GAMM|nr:gamma-butyrobetaine hydroxylase-like domain-containing protein [Thalassomonas actiniarum]WDD98401.1 DUF971 domain-containing protein [Thalassomonas actiniarum]